MSSSSESNCVESSSASLFSVTWLLRTRSSLSSRTRDLPRVLVYRPRILLAGGNMRLDLFLEVGGMGEVEWRISRIASTCYGTLRCLTQRWANARTVGKTDWRCMLIAVPGRGTSSAAAARWAVASWLEVGMGEEGREKRSTVS